jgi:membrane protein required for colicin V production
MIWVDYGILAVLLVSVIVGLVRGFAREVFGLATWVLAFWLALSFAAPFGHWLEAFINVPSVRKITAYALLFLGGLLAGGIVTALIVRVMRSNDGISSIDRTLGGGFGLLRGGLLVGAFILIGGLTPLKQDPWWSQSTLMPRFAWLADGLQTLIPERWILQIQSTDSELPAGLPDEQTDGSREGAPVSGTTSL